MIGIGEGMLSQSLAHLVCIFVLFTFIVIVCDLIQIGCVLCMVAN